MQKQSADNATNDISDEKSVGSNNSFSIDYSDSLPFATFTCNMAGYITSYNKKATELWGREVVINSDRFSAAIALFTPDGEVIAAEEGPVARTLQNGKKNDGEEIVIQAADGALRHLCVYTSPVFSSNGHQIGAVCTAVDVTEQRAIETRQALLASIIKSSDDAIISKTLDGTITSWNKSAEQLFGYSEQEAIGKHITMLIPHERLSEEDLIIGKIKSGQKIDHFETYRVTKEGKQIPISLTVSPINDLSGTVIGASKIVRDISKQKYAEEKQALLAAIIESSDDAIISKTLDGTITSWNKGAERLLGYTDQEAIGKHVTLLIPEERLSEEDMIISNIRNGNKIDHFETFRLGKNGKEIPVSLTVSPIKDPSGRVIGASKILRDIGRQKESENTLQRYAEHLEILNSVGKSISEDMDVQGILQKVTDATTQLTSAGFGAFFYNTVDDKGESYMLYTLSGVSRSAFEKFPMPRNTAVFHPTFAGERVVRIDDITKDPRYGKNEPHYGMPKGHLPVVSYLAVPVKAKSGEVIGGLFFGHPKPGMFTQEHENLVQGIASHAAVALDNAKLYQEVQQLNLKKDEFIGLASHELKTPMSSINGYLQIIERNPNDLERNKLFVIKVRQQVNKLSSLIADLLDVSKIQTGKLPFAFSEFDMVALTNEVVELMRHSNNTHHIKAQLNADQTIIVADKQRIEQVMINLLSNAIKYSPNNKNVEVTLTCTNNMVKFSVRDFGIGIDKKHLEQIFSRFYRVENLAAHMSGLGIGLYISQEIITRHKGLITVQSTPGEGSTFNFEIPVNQ